MVAAFGAALAPTPFFGRCPRSRAARLLLDLALALASATDATVLLASRRGHGVGEMQYMYRAGVWFDETLH